MQYLEDGLSTIYGYLSRQAPARRSKEVGRNDPCPCGSGKKYKKCCLRNKPRVPRVQQARDLDPSSLVPRVEDEVGFGEDLRRLGGILAATPELAFDTERVEQFLRDEGLSPDELVEGSGEEFDEVAMRFCRAHVGAAFWEKVAKALVRLVPSYLESSDDLRAILSGLMILDQCQEADNLVGIMLFRRAVHDREERGLMAFLGDLDDLSGSAEVAEVARRVEEFSASGKGRRLVENLESSKMGQQLLAEAQEEFERNERQILDLILADDFPCPPPWPLQLAAMSCVTGDAAEGREIPSNYTDVIFSRLEGELHPDDQRLMARHLDEWLEAHPDHPQGDLVSGMALLCHARGADFLLVCMGVQCLRNLGTLSYSFSLEEDVVYKGADATGEEIEALASAWEDAGYPAIAGRVRRLQARVFSQVALATAT